MVITNVHDYAFYPAPGEPFGRKPAAKRMRQE